MNTLTNTTPTDKINTIAQFKKTKKNREKQNINKGLIPSFGQLITERERVHSASQSERERESY